MRHRNGHTEVGSRWTLKDVDEFVEHLKNEHGLGHFKQEFDVVDGDSKFVSLHFKIKIHQKGSY
jgi:hypothetical protein